ncbi:hypothetical protein ACEQPO_23995 [Bacillus sp. SL00103]
MTYHYPSFEQMKYLTSEISGRIWEKTLVSDDFLRYVLGQAQSRQAMNYR